MYLFASRFSKWLLLPCTLLIVAGCSGESAKEAAAKIAQKTVEVGKGAMAGIEEGVEQGRKSTESADGAAIVTNYDEFKKLLSLEILSVSPGKSSDTVELQLGLGNKTETPVRLTGLNDSEAVILLDSDGYVNRLTSGPGELTVPKKAKEKYTFCFSGDAKKAKTLRFYGHDIEIPADKIASERSG